VADKKEEEDLGDTPFFTLSRVSWTVKGEGGKGEGRFLGAGRRRGGGEKGT